MRGVIAVDCSALGDGPGAKAWTRAQTRLSFRRTSRPPVHPKIRVAKHRKNRRKSTRGPHQAGRARLKSDKGGEKGDEERRPRRKRPSRWKGPWPPLDDTSG